VAWIMRHFSEIFTITGVFTLHGIKVELASVTLKYEQDNPPNVEAIGAKFLRKRLRMFVDLQGDLEIGDKLLATLNNENSFSRFAWRHWQERNEWSQELKQMAADYYAERGMATK
jgi:hypothetical protein